MKTIEIEIKPSEQEEEKKYDQWKVECAYNDLMRAEEIKADPELMALVAEYARQKLPGKIRSLKELKKIAAKRIKEIQDGEAEMEESVEVTIASPAQLGPKMIKGKTKPREEVVKDKFKGPQSKQEEKLRMSPNQEYVDVIDYGSKK